MLEATLDLLEEAVAVLDAHANVVFWNRAAAALTGYPPDDLLCRTLPPILYTIDEAHLQHLPLAEREEPLQRPTLVSIAHKHGHPIPAMLRRAELRNALNEITGHVLLFYPVEQNDALPHGECVESAAVERSQAAMEDRLDAAQHQWLINRVPFGLLWITVDQAQSMRKSHGREACEGMLRTVEQTLLRQLKPAEIIGRWGDDEFLVLTHERTPALLAEHARRLAGVARTADFRWWGDRVALSVSIGATPACAADSLQSLLLRAQQAMQASIYAGGNHVTDAKGELCSQS
jgi:diguanylate cyclase (GGDEF)-like protein/PAS domain S-box-containing protein